MHAAFNLRDMDLYGRDPSGLYYSTGVKNRDSQSQSIEKSIDRYINHEGELEAGEIMSDWFPDIEADIFLSHSHRDEREIIILAGMLDYEFGLKSFIDSTVWGYSGDLLWSLDDKLCRNEGGRNFDYGKRNITTSHVHLMLNTALMRMMDNAEAIFFYETPNSISLKDEVNGSTKSPWIYSEISMMQMLRRRPVQRKRELTKAMEGLVEAATMDSARPVFNYPVALDDLRLIDSHILDVWLREVKTASLRGEKTLDILYEVAKHGR